VGTSPVTTLRQNRSFCKETRAFSKAIRGLSRNSLEIAWGLLLAKSLWICPSNPEKSGGLALETSVRKQAPSDLTGSILTTFPRMSNMFLHFRQVIDSKLQKLRAGWESCGIALWLTLLGSWTSRTIEWFVLIETWSKFAPLFLSILQAGLGAKKLWTLNLIFCRSVANQWRPQL